MNSASFWDHPPLYLEPSGQPAKACIIWLHGLGANGEDFAPVAEALALPYVRHILPHAPQRPVTHNQGRIMRAWYDIALDGEKWLPNDQDLLCSAQAVVRLINTQQAQGIAPEYLFVAGFSQGGAVALAATTRYPSQLGGVLALSTYLPLPDELPDAASKPHALPIFMAHGKQDPVIEWCRGDQSRRHLEQHGYSVTWHSYPMAHSVCLDEMHDMAQWLGSRLPT